MSLRQSDDVNETAELTLAQAQHVSAWLTRQITTPHLGLQTLECQAD